MSTSSSIRTKIFMLARLSTKAVRRYASNGEHGHHNKWHFENNRPEDALPFSTDNKLGLALKMIVFCGLGLGTPIFTLMYQCSKG